MTTNKQEPVAWIYSVGDRHAVELRLYRDDELVDGCVVTPLYAEPQSTPDVENLLEEVLRLRVAMAKAAQRADDWPDSNDDPADVLSDCASILFDALDYRHTST